MVESIALLEPAREEYRDLADTADFVRLASELARAYMLQGRPEDALRVVDETLPTAERLQLNRETLDLLATRGPTLAAAGRLREAIVTLVGAVASATSYGLVDVGLRARINLSYAAAAEDPQMAFRVAREGFELVRHLGMHGYESYLVGNAAEFAIHIGEWEWARTALEESIARSEHDVARFRLAELRGLMGHDVEAEFAVVAKSVEESTEVQAQATVNEGMAVVALAAGDLARALDLARRSYERLVSPDSPALQIAGRAAAWLGDEATLVDVNARLARQPGRLPAATRRETEAALAALQGRRAEAAAGFADALARWRELGYDVEQALCALDWVTMLGPSDPDGRAAAEDARVLFDRLGAVPLQALLAAAMDSGAAAPAHRPGAPAATPATVEAASAD
jgi:tetratricopeptide (TPR) repeat protein